MRPEGSPSRIVVRPEGSPSRIMVRWMLPFRDVNGFCEAVYVYIWSSQAGVLAGSRLLLILEPVKVPS